MNAHDSEKVIGTLQHEGYRQVENEEDAGLILYNTCSIRDKAEQKVFNRLNDYKNCIRPEAVRRAGCVAQQEAKRSSSARRMCRWFRVASYASCPNADAAGAGETRITGLDDGRRRDL